MTGLGATAGVAGEAAPDDVAGHEMTAGAGGQWPGLTRRVGDRLPQPRVLVLEFLEPLHLVGLQAAELLAPPVAGELRHADRPHRLGRRLAL